MRLEIALMLFGAFVLPAAAFEQTQSIKVTPLLKTTTTWEGKPIVYPKGQAEITGLIIEIAAGGETGWHSHPVPSFGTILEGTLAVTLKDGRVKELKTGDSLAEVIGTPHNGRVVGDRPVKLIVFYAGAIGTPLTMQER
jgi:quercetin dioxygenase-like cupin family protein